jgi:hypothetical protein
MKKPPPTVVERIDAALHTLNHSASGATPGTLVDIVSKRLASDLLRTRELAETLEGFLRSRDA